MEIRLVERVPLRDGEPCKHPGCLSHVTHPCEGCGRIAGRPAPWELDWHKIENEVDLPLRDKWVWVTTQSSEVMADCCSGELGEWLAQPIGEDPKAWAELPPPYETP